MRVLLLVSLLFFNTMWLRAQSIVKLWEAKNQLPIPESVYYLSGKEMLYVSLVDGDPLIKDGKGGIAMLNLDGSLKDSQWISGLNAPKGLTIYKDLLYAADINTVQVIDIISGNIIDEIIIPSATSLYDVSHDDEGIIYVSDSGSGTIFQLKNGKSNIFLDNASHVKGLKYDKGRLVALVGTELWSIGANKEIKVIAKGFEKEGYGLEAIGNGDYLVTCLEGLVYYVKADGTSIKLQDMGAVNTANLAYNPKTKMLYIPTFTNNSVQAYQLK